MRLYKIISNLLDYPDREIIENLDELIQIIDNSFEINRSEKESLLTFINWMSGQSVIEIQQEYVKTFDMTPEHSLHLTHHIFGDDKERGPALIDLQEHFKKEGFEMKPGEIPDYLPLLLEYVATLDEHDSGAFLADANKIIKILSKNLSKANSPFAELTKILENRARTAETT